jgi:hypothetical protein
LFSVAEESSQGLARTHGRVFQRLHPSASHCYFAETASRLEKADSGGAQRCNAIFVEVNLSPQPAHTSTL